MLHIKLFYGIPECWLWLVIQLLMENLLGIWQPFKLAWLSQMKINQQGRKGYIVHGIHFTCRKNSITAKPWRIQLVDEAEWRNLLMQSPPDQPGRHSAQYLPLMKKSSLGPHVPLLQRLQFSNILQPERKRDRNKRESGWQVTMQRIHRIHFKSFKRAVIVCQNWELFAQTLRAMSPTFTRPLFPLYQLC